MRINKALPARSDQQLSYEQVRAVLVSWLGRHVKVVVCGGDSGEPDGLGVLTEINLYRQEGAGSDWLTFYVNDEEGFELWRSSFRQAVLTTESNTDNFLAVYDTGDRLTWVYCE